MTKKCKQCGKEFRTYPCIADKNNFCSRVCSHKGSARIQNIIGTSNHYSKVIKLTRVERRKSHGGNKRYYLCSCICGKEFETSDESARKGVSCGCKHIEYSKTGNAKRTHGMSKSKFHNTWTGMKGRCSNKHNQDYYLYGGRGIKVCKRWQNFESFKEDMYDSFLEHMEKHPYDTSIDRIDSEDCYCKENCRWATAKIQGRNTRRVNQLVIEGISHYRSDWCKIAGIDRKSLDRRLAAGWTPKQAVFSPKITNQFDGDKKVN